MLFSIEIFGKSGLIMHDGVTAFDPTLPINREKSEIAKKKGSNRTEADDARLRELECLSSLWLNENGLPAIPPRAIRANIETAARKLKQGPMVREGLFVETVSPLVYDTNRYGEVDKLGVTAQFTVPVVVQRQRIARTRALLEPPWSCTYILDCDDELVDGQMLDTWLDIAGRRVGLGDWRPAKSGTYGRFGYNITKMKK